MTAKAELDEFRIFKAQMNKHLGIQPRWSAKTKKEMRKRSEIDPNKFSSIWWMMSRSMSITTRASIVEESRTAR